MPSAAALKRQKQPPVSWSELPHKDQLFLLVLCRFSEPLTMSSLRSYMYYQLKHFDPSQSDAAISTQAGYMASAFTFAQFLTAIAWGRAADSQYFGRKKVILIGLLGTGISSVGFGFSQTFWTAIAFRALGGLLNGNVGVMRTMVSEMIKEKKYQSRAFMLMPMTGNIGFIIGPIIGGFLADPVNAYPQLFGKNSFFGGRDGVWWMTKWPYALPNLVSACFLVGSALVVVLGLRETHRTLKDRRDWGIEFRNYIVSRVLRRGDKGDYMPVATDDSLYDPYQASVLELPDTPLNSPMRASHEAPVSAALKQKKVNKLPFRRIFTRNVIITVISRGLLVMHIGTFSELWYIFLSTPREKDANAHRSGVHFTGGLGLSPNRTGVVLSLIGGIGIFFQLILYPAVSQRLGTTLSYRLSLPLFPVAYFLAPFLVLLPSVTAPPSPAAGPFIWLGILAVLFFHVLARTFAIPSVTILVNNCCPHPSVLSSIHGVAQSVSSGMRMLGPLFGGWGFALALQVGVIGIPFWTITVLAAMACLLSLAVTEGDGHEIKLEGEEDEEEEEEHEEEVRRQEEHADEVVVETVDAESGNVANNIDVVVATSVDTDAVTDRRTHVHNVQQS